MCLFIGSEIFLSVALDSIPSANEGLSFSDLENYSTILKENLYRRLKINCVSIDYTFQSLRDCVYRNPDSFRFFQNHYYPGFSLKLSRFEYQVKKEILMIMKDSAKQVGRNTSSLSSEFKFRDLEENKE